MSAEGTGPPPTGDQIRDVYAHFGLAYYLAECLHAGVANLYSSTGFADRAHGTRPRIDERMARIAGQTFGQAVREAAGLLPPDLLSPLEQAVEQRNQLAHGYWYKRAHLFTSVEGIAEMLSELTMMQQQFESVLTSLNAAQTAEMRRLGIFEEAISRAYGEVVEGVDLADRVQSRRVRAHERIVRAWLTNNSPAAALIFEAEDGTLFQLCEVGLGWTRFQRAPEWVPDPDLQALLPAQVEARPPGGGPWCYVLTFNGRGALEVEWCAHRSAPVLRRRGAPDPAGTSGP